MLPVQPVTEPLQCDDVTHDHVLIFGLFIAKNFAEILFQTMEPIFRALVHIGVLDLETATLKKDEITLVLIGSAADYKGAVFELPLRMLAVLGKILFLDDMSTGTL